MQILWVEEDLTNYPVGSLVGTFHLTIFLRVVSQDEIKMHVETSFQELKEVWNEFRLMIRSNMGWNIMFRENMDYEQSSQVI